MISDDTTTTVKESMILWDTFLLMGGSLEPEPDPQSPFYFAPASGEGPTSAKSFAT